MASWKAKKKSAYTQTCKFWPEEGCALLREHTLLLQSYELLSWEYYISVNLEEGLLNDDHKLYKARKDCVICLRYCLAVEQNACMWKRISRLSAFLRSPFFLSFFLSDCRKLIVSDCTQDILQNPLKSTEKLPGRPQTQFLWFLLKIISIHPQCARIIV